MKSEMKLPTNGILLENITLPKFYSVRFELLMDENDINDKTRKIILTMNGKYPSFLIKINKSPKLVFETKISSTEPERRDSISISSESYKEWLSFKKMSTLKIISVAQHNIENKRSINVFQIFTTATFLENNSCVK